MKEYTEKIHAARVLKMLERKNPCGLCPAAKYYKYNLYKQGVRCMVCNEFLEDGEYDPFLMCPCTKYGEKEAQKRTWIQLEAKGYLE